MTSFYKVTKIPGLFANIQHYNPKKKRAWAVWRVSPPVEHEIIGRHNGITHPTIERTVALVDAALARTKVSAA